MCCCGSGEIFPKGLGLKWGGGGGRGLPPACSVGTEPGGHSFASGSWAFLLQWAGREGEGRGVFGA